jgi:hypothetical protein
MTLTLTLEGLIAAIESRGGLSPGRHSPGPRCCLLEAVSVAAGVAWTDDPYLLDEPDVQRLNDARWSSEEAMTSGCMRLAPLLVAWPAWSPERRIGWARAVALRTVREILPIALRAIGVDGTACVEACDPDVAVAAAERAAAIAWQYAARAYKAPAEEACRAAAEAAINAAGAIEIARYARPEESLMRLVGYTDTAAHAAVSAAHAASDMVYTREHGRVGDFHSTVLAGCAAADRVLDLACRIWAEEAG